MPKFIDEEGNVHSEGLFGGSWQKDQGVFGPTKDVNWLGQPNYERDLLGRPVQAQTPFGSPIYNNEGQPLYKASPSADFSGGGGDALAGLAAIGILVLGVLLIGALLAGLAKLFSAVFEGYRGLMRRHPWPMRIFHLSLGMILVYSILWLAGFSLEFRLFGIALVPALWGWIRLTRKLPLVFMPINAALIGAGLWLAAQYTLPIWQSTWLDLTAGLPLVGDLRFLLAVIPMTLWLWTLGSRRWPWVFKPIAQLAVGALLWFLLMRVWIDWQPYWMDWMEPVPFLIPVAGWLILFLPLFLWLRKQGQDRWPLPFIALNMLIFGAILGLAAYHTQPSWQSIWHHWMAGMPFVAAPLLVITLAPLSLWSWSWASNRWKRYFAIPNLLISGFIIWLILDRTRLLWTGPWELFWGSVPIAVDPAIVIPLLPLAVWGWRQASQRWPQYWGAARAILWGGIFWWLAERTRQYWQFSWKSFAGPNSLDLALLVGVTPLIVWLRSRLRPRWPLATSIFTWVILTALILWFVSNLYPDSSLLIRLAIAFLPLSARGWLWLLNRNWMAGCGTAIMIFLFVAILILLNPEAVIKLLTESLTSLNNQVPP